MLPLAARELCRLFPSLWPTPKAAERWGAKNPPEAYKDIIRVWEVFVDYKPKQRRRWSRALVRHGADPQMALAVVLDVPAEDIQVRDPAGSHPGIKAIATSTWVPNSPSTPSSPPAAKRPCCRKESARRPQKACRVSHRGMRCRRAERNPQRAGNALSRPPPCIQPEEDQSSPRAHEADAQSLTSLAHAVQG